MTPRSGSPTSEKFKHPQTPACALQGHMDCVYGGGQGPGTGAGDTYSPSFLSLSAPPPPSHSSRPSQSARLGPLWKRRLPAGYLFTQGSVCMSGPPPQLAPPSPSPAGSTVSSLCLHSFPVNRFISTVLHRFLLTSFWPGKPNCSVFSCLCNLGAAVCAVFPSLIWIQGELVIFQPIQLATCC